MMNQGEIDRENAASTLGPPNRLLIVPVTALEFVEDFLLAGEGPYLKIYRTSPSNKALVSNTQIFTAANIHGITTGQKTSTNSYLVGIHGSKCCSVVEFDLTTTRIHFQHTQEFDDWILSISWLPQDENQLVMVTAHNAVIRWDWKKQTVLQTVHCQEKCILYSALVIGDTWSHLVVAGGTVFNQVVLWSVNVETNDTSRQPVIYRLSGHQGVIFSITYNAASRLLCSVSDDRSIRVWHIRNKSTPTDDAGETGTSEEIKQSKPINWVSAQFDLCHVLYGHAARVWSARYLGDHLVSIGEDSTCCVWNMQGQQVNKFKGHRGKSIWSLAVNETSELIATGGGDTSIRIWKMHGDQNRSDNLIFTPLVPPSHLLDAGEKVKPKVTCLMDKNTILIMTDVGRLYRYFIDTCTWSREFADDAFSSYSVIAVSPDQAMLAIGSLTGTVRLYTEGCWSLKQCYEGKLFSLAWLTNELLLTTGPEGEMVLWCLNRDDEGHLDLEHQMTLSLPVAKQRWMSAAELISDQQLLVCGDRVGSVHVYDLSQQMTDPVQSFWKLHGKAGVTDVCYDSDHVYTAGRNGEYCQYRISPQRQLELLHSSKVMKGLEWIARLWFSGENGDMHILGFYTDQFIMYSVATNQTILSLPCGGGHRAWDIIADEESGDVTFVFVKAGRVEMCRTHIHGDHTILKPSLHGREVTDAKFISFISTQDGMSSIIATSSEDTRINLLKIQVRQCGLQLYSVLATLQSHISSVRCLASSPSLKPISDIESQRSSCDRLKMSTVVLFSAGGRAQLKAWRITVEMVESARNCDDNVPCSSAMDNKSTPVQVMRQRVRYENLASHNLHEKSRRNRKPWRKMIVNLSPETRFMCLDALPLRDVFPDTELNVHLLAAACSDGFVRLLCFDEEYRSFQMMAQSDAHDHCVLTVRLILTKHTTPTERLVHLCSAGTDGRVLFWDVTELIQQHATCLGDRSGHDNLDGTRDSKKYYTRDEEIRDLPQPDLLVEGHQSGVNALDLYAINDEELLLVTGGDDNSLSLHRLVSHNENQDGCQQRCLSVAASSKHDTAHAAQINGVHVDDKHTVRSVSIDQRLIRWNIDSQLKLTQIDCQFVHVSDVSHMETWTSSRGEPYTVITGMGLEFMSS